MRKCSITDDKPTHGTVRKRHRTLKATRQQVRNQSKAVFLSEIIAKLGRSLSIALQKNDQTKCPINNGSDNKQRIMIRTTVLKWTAAQATVGLKYILQAESFTYLLLMLKHRPKHRHVNRGSLSVLVFY